MKSATKTRSFPWYIPSWNGDMRLVPAPGDPKSTLLTLERPTAEELATYLAIERELTKRKWIDKPAAQPASGADPAPLLIKAEIEKVGPVVAPIMRPGPAVLSAMLLANGKLVTSTEGPADLAKVAEGVAKDAKDDPKKQPVAAATVKRPTPCCPKCFEDPSAVRPAAEVLLAFLDESQHRTWAERRAIVITGGLSGHRYMLAHRSSKLAAQIGRVCYDLDLGTELHFHDWTVPAEEEVLAAMLILQEREPWLRNEATMFHRSPGEYFKNPFGDMSDGTFDSGFTVGFGIGVRALSMGEG